MTSSELSWLQTCPALSMDKCRSSQLYMAQPKSFSTQLGPMSERVRKLMKWLGLHCITLSRSHLSMGRSTGTKK